MAPYLDSLVAMAAVGAYAAVHHGWIWLRRRDLVAHREFACLALSVAAASLAGLWLQTADGDLRRPDDVVWLCHLAEGVFLVRFVNAFAAPAARRLPRLLQACLVAGMVLVVLLPNGLMAGPERIPHIFPLPWAETVRYLGGQAGFLYIAVAVAAAACLVWCLATAVRAWRASRSGHQFALLLSLVGIAAAVGNNIVFDLLDRPTIPLIPHSFALLALVMGYVLTAAVARSAELEERLRRAERLEQLGRLAGGVAHDFGNLLTGIVGHAELLADDLAAHPELRARARSIADSGVAASSLVRRMLVFARGGGGGHRAEVDLHQLLHEVATLVRTGAGRRIAIAVRPCPEEVHIEGDPARLLSAMLNLAMNARDAMGEGGALVMATTLRGPPAGAPIRHRPRSERLVEIAISDTGPGIPAAVLSRLFEPFFTTKGAAGTGLGLVQVDETVRDHGGAIGVESRPGAGATFRIWLPLAAAQVAVPDELPLAPPGARVLVVADEAAVRQLAEAALAALGYEVATAPTEEAAARIRDGGMTAAVIDVPGVRGVDLLAELRREAPHLPAVFVDGANAPPESLDTTVLRRPARPEELARALAGVLAGR